MKNIIVTVITRFFEQNWFWFALVLAVLIIIIAVFLLRRRIRGRKCKSTVRLDGKTVIVTGSNIGIGKETARDFCRRGARVILACRSMERASEAARDIELSVANSNGRVAVRKLDLSNFKSIRKFAKHIIETEDKINILVNNAGIMSEKKKSDDGFDLVLQSNHLGAFLLTNLLLPKIINSAPSRIVNVSSSLHSRGTIDWDDLNLDEKGAYGPLKAYCQSKLANILFTKELARQLKDIIGVTVYAVNPGPVHTGFFRNSSDYVPFILRVLMHIIIPLLYKTPKQGAQTTIYCAVSNEEASRTGLYYSNCKEEKPSKEARSTISAKKLWEISSEMVKLDDE